MGEVRHVLAQGAGRAEGAVRNVLPQAGGGVGGDTIGWGGSEPGTGIIYERGEYLFDFVAMTSY